MTKQTGVPGVNSQGHMQAATHGAPADVYEALIGQKQEASGTFDIFVQNVDLRWCLLLCCDYESLTVLRQLGSVFVRDVPLALNSKEWCSSAARTAELHAAQWAAGGEDVLHKPLRHPLGQTVVRLQCATDNARDIALANGAQLDELGDPVIVVTHPVGLILSAAQLAATAPPIAAFLREPLALTTTTVAGATHNHGAVQHVCAIVRREQGTAPVRTVRAYRTRHLVASGGLDGISRVATVTLTARADALHTAPLSVQRGLRHGGALTAVEVRPNGVLLTACRTSSTLRVYELEAAHLAAERIATAGIMQTLPAVSPAGTAGLHEWNYVERARLQGHHAQPTILGARWLSESTLVEAGFDRDGEGEVEDEGDGAHETTTRAVLRTWRLVSHHSTPSRATVAWADAVVPGSVGELSALAADDELVVVAHNPPQRRAGAADVWRVVAAADACAPPTLKPLCRLQEHTEELYACAVGGGLLATGGDDCTVRLWSATAIVSSATDGPDRRERTEHASVQTLMLGGKVWALALHSHLLVAGGALASDGGLRDGQIRVRLFCVADLAAGRGLAVALRTLQAPSIAREWGVRSVATHGGTIVVAGGDDGVVHVWALAEKGKADHGDHGADDDDMDPMPQG